MARTTTPKTDAPAEPTVVQATAQEVADSGQHINQWEFSINPPTREQVLELLTNHRDVWGLKYSQYSDYVQALPQNKKISRRVDGRKEDIYYENWTLYVSVGGRIAMLSELTEVRGWTSNFVPEPVTPTGVPGFISLGHEGEEGRIIYREYLEILDEEGKLVGRKPGMAWVPYKGGQQAAGSNPYEKVETSARGRSLGAWGIGVIPGSGIATVEEIAQMWENKALTDQGLRPRSTVGNTRKTREQLIGESAKAMENLREASGWTQDEVETQILNYMVNALGVKEPAILVGEKMELNWDKVKDGQLAMLVTSLNERADAVRAQGLTNP
ncbi:hypothetical protein KITKAT_61 [Arthrobacter phage Kitkat]|uniref:Uncharacterized protein n=2 Tax=Kelleziovirus kitkat TaxID=1982238 RepID=A0A140G6N7_9CAUD|nr:hypothetical protein BJD77_gp061 [Arthrobacter phage Kitkat]AMM44322.1 hypothetical protein KITKAT_61 [Arthrobacter phage Kitkat]QGJ96499.1 hypothetical protein SEA_BEATUSCOMEDENTI_60 [Arthrobacter phage BeatusComedenti]